VTEWWCTNKR